jgi:hypothetical protein
VFFPIRIEHALDVPVERAFITPIRANIVGPSFSATSNGTSRGCYRLAADWSFRDSAWM